MVYEDLRDNKSYYNIGLCVSHGHFHRSTELLFCIKKEKTVSLDGIEMCLHENELLVVPPFCVHVFPLIKEQRSLCVVMPVGYTDLIEKNSAGKKLLPQIIRGDAAAEIYALLDRLPDAANSVLTDGIYTCIVGLLLANADFSDSGDTGDSDFRLRALMFIEKHYEENICLADMAADLGYNRCYFSELFNRTFGVHFRSYLNMVRVSRSFSLLATMNASDAARAVGFMTEQSYYSNFKKITGVTPREYCGRKSRGRR